MEMACKRMTTFGTRRGGVHTAGVPGRVVGRPGDVLRPGPTKYKIGYPFHTVSGFARAAKKLMFRRQSRDRKGPGPRFLCPAPAWTVRRVRVGPLSGRQSRPQLSAALSGQGTDRTPTSIQVPRCSSRLGWQEGPADAGETVEFGKREVRRRAGGARRTRRCPGPTP